MWYNSGEVIMMANTTYNIRIDKEIREQADVLYKSMGLSLSSAINLFLTQSVIQGKLPIAEVVALPQYADILLRDAAETDVAISNGTAEIYTTPGELFKAWESEE
jgi:DNA-damage-inducible protein J